MTDIISDSFGLERFQNFSLNNENNNYRRHVDGYNSFSTAGDCLLLYCSYHNDMQFSTKNRDNNLLV